MESRHRPRPLNYWQDFDRTGIDIYDQYGNLVRQTDFCQGSGIASHPSAEVSWYVVDDWKPRANVMIEYGVRQDWDELLHRAAFSPRVSAAWAPFASKNTKFLAGYAVLRDETPLPFSSGHRTSIQLTTFSIRRCPRRSICLKFPIRILIPGIPELDRRHGTAPAEKNYFALNGIHKRGRRSGLHAGRDAGYFRSDQRAARPPMTPPNFKSTSTSLARTNGWPATRGPAPTRMK